MNSYCIYCYTNTINDKRYIGQTKDVKKRCHPSNYKGCQKFYAAIQKYGYDNFLFTIIEDGLTLDEANEREEYYISLFDTIENGYNLRSGGLNNEFSEESKEKMSLSCATKKAIKCIETGETFKSAKEIERKFGYSNTNIIACCKGKLHTAYGYTWEYINDLEKPIRTDKRKKGVYCVELDCTFESAAAAARTLNINRPNITNCCLGKLKHAGGYTWRYAIQEEE